jgi:inorganic triphosphatase YgiF
MKLRFGIDAAACERIRGLLDGRCDEPPVGRRLSYVYLDTPDGALAKHDVALRFRRRAAIGASAARRPWRREEIWGKRSPAGASIKALGIKRLKQRIDATFSIRIERWTWRPDDGWAAISLDNGTIATGRTEQAFSELRIVCNKKHADAATHYAVELGAMHLASTRARERGQALIEHEASPG